MASSSPPSSPKLTGYTALRRGRVSLSGGVYLITTVTRSRTRFFADPRLARSAAECFDDPAVLGANRMLAWVLMPDHVHWLFELGLPPELSASVGRMKAAISRRLNAQRRAPEPWWEPGFHDHALRREESIRDAAMYIVANLIRAGLVSRIEDYPYWNTLWRE